MLHFLKRDLKRKVQFDALGKFNLQAIPGSPYIPIPFDPITSITDFNAGYYMNFDNQIPLGSINSVPSTSDWMDIVTLNILNKSFKGTAVTNTDLVNGFNCESLTTINQQRFYLNTVDLFTGQIDFSYLIGFKTVLSGTDKCLTSFNNELGNLCHNFFLKNTQKLSIQLTDYINTYDYNSILNYDQNVWHIAVVLINQSSNTISFYTDLGENISGLINLIPMTPFINNININKTNLGRQRFNPTITYLNYFFPGNFGDIVFYNKILTVNEINSLLQWEANRLGIGYVPF